ncbi:MAG: cob(I)yrinic acid a,c-diamide adenosyltransferase [Candidatus Eremiobacteraeota bacterium]|nr:cob(I)yrinic acid a,c-diamide adenosyltransferase [Candidatus Eremiobacteraeota bacterium]MBV9262748.1 cob(I)yrinic acid a,c-diamide adenosyltransferase [Candidatus Eremiobacteraeota bacterium]
MTGHVSPTNRGEPWRIARGYVTLQSHLGATVAKFTRIYTRTGDDGTTGLIGGRRIKKSSVRIAAYGTLDELSSAIGLARALCGEGGGDRAAVLDAWLAWAQDVLFNAGSQLAAVDEKIPGIPAVTQTDVTALERAIDSAQNDLPPLNNFIHPGGSLAAAQLHVARTVCRRAERLIVELRDEDDRGIGESIQYLNRLSDALFVWARWMNDRFGVPDHLWNPASSPPQ